MTVSSAPVTVAFERVFLDGPRAGVVLYGFTKKVAPAIAARLKLNTTEEGMDPFGNRYVDRFFYRCADDAKPDAIEARQRQLEAEYLNS